MGDELEIDEEMELDPELNRITDGVIGAAIEVHRILGPGLLESVYEQAMAIESLASIHSAQVISYLRITGHRLGLLINFNVRLLKDGIKRIAL